MVSTHLDAGIGQEDRAELVDRRRSAHEHVGRAGVLALKVACRVWRWGE